jgi:hypothetical protein
MSDYEYMKQKLESDVKYYGALVVIGTIVMVVGAFIEMGLK